MNRRFVFAVAFLASSAPTLSRADVLPMDSGDHGLIRVSIITETTRRFEFCEDASEKVCRRLGNRDYTVAELKELAARNYALGSTKLVGDTALVAGAAAAGAALGFFGTSTAILASPLHGWCSVFCTALAGTIVGGGAGAGAGVVIARYFNPVENFARARALRSDVINDKDVRVSDVRGTARRITEALDSVPPGVAASAGAAR